MRVLVLNQSFHPAQSATSELLTEPCQDLARHHEVTRFRCPASRDECADTVVCHAPGAADASAAATDRLPQNTGPRADLVAHGTRCSADTTG